MRGWVFQEKLLAPRALLFARSEISWRCLCERSYEISPSCKANDLNLPTFESSYDDIVDRLRFDLYSKTSCLRSIFQGWYEMVEAYSDRQLICRSDVIPAISGIVSSIIDPYDCSFIAGLWIDDMARGFVWQVEKYYPPDCKPYDDRPWTTIKLFDGCPLRNVTLGRYAFGLWVLGARLIVPQNDNGGSHGEQNLVLKIRAHVKKAVIRESIGLVGPRDKTRLIPLIGDDDIYSSHCIGIVPAMEGSNVFIRVGYFHIENHNKFFEDIESLRDKDMNDIKLV
ncbi:hypothetical protein NA56DRAFT_713259 [Hyaloscypha hepaticicola]|uniref:Heterokaryon incompatibility domain-containing protein n=1 Tax=Hyaloscypha hepaticicola TaxID=2082293 RepID=A0A2J6PE71_9HELO|nr:hypothetical protein NA56DRAFT_713259 [Hyaloscypha hepaticicola]